VVRDEEATRGFGGDLHGEDAIGVVYGSGVELGLPDGGTPDAVCDRGSFDPGRCRELAQICET
jgi:hypothetical protein